MNFEYAPEVNASLDAFAKLCREKIAPRAPELDRAPFDQAVALLRENLKALAEFGYLGLLYPPEYGGSARAYVEAVAFHQELTRACASTFLSAGASVGLGGAPIIHFGTEKQKNRFLPALIRAELIGCLGLTEPDCGTDLAAIRTRAERRGDGWLLNGTKMFITNAPICDFAVVLAKIVQDGQEHGTGLFLVERGAKGFSTGAPLAKMGYRGSPTGELIFDDCLLPADALLGEAGRGYAQAMQTLGGGRVGMAASAVGLAQACFEEAVKYANQRKAFGHKIIRFQEVSYKIADMKMLIDTGELLARRAAWLLDTKAPDADAVGRCAKVFCTEAATKISSWAVQIHGGYGYLAEFPVERLYREAKLGEIGEGTNEIQRVMIALDCLARWA
jgi:alkylation response protein AidB-like acyl-CoA dehydrogenase